jgi:hypothetical protein
MDYTFTEKETEMMFNWGYTSEFSTRGLVEIRRGSIRLLDIEGLRKIG